MANPARESSSWGSILKCGSKTQCAVAATGVVALGAAVAYYVYKKRQVKSSSVEEQKDQLIEHKEEIPTGSLVPKGCELFKQVFQEDPQYAALAPGRVNLIGEHIDYNDGFVLPMAIERATAVVGRANGLDKFRLYSAHVKLDFGFKFLEFTREEMLDPSPGNHWHNYIRGVVAQFVEDKAEVPYFDLLVIGNVPLGGGLSSSASLEVATATFLESVIGSPVAKLDKVLMCQRAEHVFAHVPCGIMDQYISTFGVAKHALLIDCLNQRAENVKMDDPNIAVLITNSNVKHELSGGEYGIRKQQCEQARKALRASNKSINNWRDVKMEDLEGIKKDIHPVIFQRARHVITEIDRTQRAAAALESGDFALMGKLMKESHQSLQVDYEVSCAELDFLVHVANGFDGVYGSRMTGGGFGGCTVTLVKADRAEALTQALQSAYSNQYGKSPSFIITRAADGAHAVKI